MEVDSGGGGKGVYGQVCKATEISNSVAGA